MAEQEHFDVVIIGAGPAGLVLAVALAHYKIKSIIIEKNTEICEDPRAIAMTGDTTRILEVLGVTQARMKKISQTMPAIYFHTSTFTAPPFLSTNLERDFEQVLPLCSVLLQPGLEKILRDMIEISEYAHLRLGSEGKSIVEIGERVQVTYRNQDGSEKQVLGSFLVGADGKRGFVRKDYLELKGIKQEVGIYPYEATWAVANLDISLPTPESHPDFPLWKLGYTPEELWDIFWPEGFHFCRHPTMPVATGRFGPSKGKFWRFEYELPPNYQIDDAEAHLRETIRPHLILPGSRFSRKGMMIDHPVHYPEDCVRVLRCGPASFNNRVVNRWFHNRILLIGDAAHVFPPFGAQGIANGIRDAFGLSWRLNILLRGDSMLTSLGKKHRQNFLLNSWARERRRGVDDASRRTEANGNLLLGKSNLAAAVIGIASYVLEWVPYLDDYLVRKQELDIRGFNGVEDGFFLDGLSGLSAGKGGAGGGSRKTAQIYVKESGKGSSLILSDRLFWRNRCSLTLLLLRRTSQQEALEIRQAIQAVNLPPPFLAEEIMELCGEETDTMPTAPPLSDATTKISTIETFDPDGPKLLKHYDPCAFRKRFQLGALCALVRPDFIIFSQALTTTQLHEQLSIAAAVLLPVDLGSKSSDANMY